MQSQIKNQYTNTVIFECELPDDMPSGLVMRHTLEKAVPNGANLSGANLSGGKKLIGDRPYFVVGPIGARLDYFTSWITDKGVFVSAGCFVEKTIDEFRAKLESEHGDNIHAKEYKAALMMIEAHAELWTPK